MSIQINISPRIIPSIATLYNDTNRIFMEYIDNAIDSAEEFFDKISNSYNKEINIILSIQWNDYKDWKVIIKDNCFWITNFSKVVQSIWNSDKKEQPWTNGQFWYWIYSFMAACKRLEIKSKLIDSVALYIPIDREQFSADKQEDVNFPDPRIITFDCDSWTEITLSNFEKLMWKSICVEDIQNEIEKHFELLLNRGNLNIIIINWVYKYKCKPFDYEVYDWKNYKGCLSELVLLKWRKKATEIKLIPPKPIEIYLKVTKGKVINKLPVFIIKWRRVWAIWEIFKKSEHRSDIWSHPNVTGYIDLSDFLEPTIARNDFKNNDRSNALFYTLKLFEPIILGVIKEVNEESDKQHYKILEDYLNKALSKLAKIDSMNFRTEYLHWNDINLSWEWWWQSIEDGFWWKDFWQDESNGGGEWVWENDGDWIWPSWNPWKDIFGWNTDWDLQWNKESENPFEDTDLKWWEKKKSWFNIKIDDSDPPINNEWKALRSLFSWWEIRIYRKHPSFEERVETSRKWESRISQRLITYLAWEITVHYKDKLQTKNWEQPEYNIALFENLVEFIYMFENILKDVAWKNLSEFN